MATVVAYPPSDSKPVASIRDVTHRYGKVLALDRISLDIPKSAKATLNARSVNGGITVSGLPTSDEASGRRIRTLESQLNGGGPAIDVRVTNGRISITGTENSESRVESQGVERPGVTKQGVRSPEPR